MNMADLVISRAGINTVTELLYLEKPSILIPLLTGQQNEQEVNAHFLKNAGLGRFISQKVLTSELLLSQIHEMFASINIYALKIPLHENERNEHAAEKLVEVLSHVASKTVSQEKHSPS